MYVDEFVYDVKGRSLVVLGWIMVKFRAKCCGVFFFFGVKCCGVMAYEHFFADYISL